MNDHDDESLGDLGVVAPMLPLPRRPRRQVVAYDTPLTYLPQAATATVLPEWVAKVRAWTPPTDLATRTVKVTYGVDGIIAMGKVGALVAAGGTGKTVLQILLGICIATGRRFLGHGVKHGTFVLMSSDDSQEDLDGALAKVTQAMSPKLTPAELTLVQEKLRVFSLQGLRGSKTFATVIGGTPQPTGLVDCVLQALEGITDLVGVGFDTLRQFSGGSSNDEQVIKLTIEGATAVAVATGAFVILSHHTGKQNYRDGVDDMYCGSGSAAIADNCRFVLLLQKTSWADIAGKVERTGQEGGNPFVLTSTRGSLLVKAPPPIYLHRDEFYIGRVAGAVMSKDRQEDEKDRAVLRAVREGAQSKNAIYARVKGRKGAANARVDELEGRSLLMRDGSGSGSASYVLTSEGVRFLEYAE